MFRNSPRFFHFLIFHKHFPFSWKFKKLSIFLQSNEYFKNFPLIFLSFNIFIQNFTKHLFFLLKSVFSERKLFFLNENCFYFLKFISLFFAETENNLISFSIISVPRTVFVWFWRIISNSDETWDFLQYFHVFLGFQTISTSLFLRNLSSCARY